MSPEGGRETVSALRAARAAHRLASDVALSSILNLRADRCRSCGQAFTPAGKTLREATLCPACREVRPLMASDAVRLARFVEILCFELRIPCLRAGLAPFADGIAAAGLHPHGCYYVANVAAARRIGECFDPAVHPPPDLVVDADVAGHRTPWGPACAALGVPELWRCDGRHFDVFALAGGEYEPRNLSPAFPFLPIPDLRDLLARLHRQDDATVSLGFQQWVRALIRNVPF
jgi:hypothetical protein